MKQTASGWVILTRNLVGGFHPQNDTQGRTDLLSLFAVSIPPLRKRTDLGV